MVMSLKEDGEEYKGNSRGKKWKEKCCNESLISKGKYKRNQKIKEEEKKKKLK